MNETASHDPCDAFSQDLSAFLDGELPFPESLATVDHLASCESCRTFYLSSRRLAERVVAGPTQAAPDELWSRVVSKVGRAHETTRRRTLPKRAWALGLAAAAAVIIAVVISDRRTVGPEVASAGKSVPSALHEIVVEGARGRMTDERFFSILTEILAADRKYHRETERVLRFVDRRESPAEPEPEAASPTGESETQEDAGESEESGASLES